MLKSKLMKSLVVAGLICATSVPVFAAEQPEAPQPTMRERVEQILHEDDNNVQTITMCAARFRAPHAAAPS